MWEIPPCCTFFTGLRRERGNKRKVWQMSRVKTKSRKKLDWLYVVSRGGKWEKWEAEQSKRRGKRPCIKVQVCLFLVCRILESDSYILCHPFSCFLLSFRNSVFILGDLRGPIKSFNKFSLKTEKKKSLWKTKPRLHNVSVSVFLGNGCLKTGDIR